MKTLQQQYLLIKEGKGNKEQFLKHARYLFPEFITVNNDYNTTTSILKGKGILTEAVGGIATLNPNKPDWFKIFDTNLREAVGVKDKEEYGDQNTFKASKETEETLKKANFDNADPKNIDNVYGQSFLVGYYTEMKDPKNADKTVDELKDIVLKNMSKDVTYYNTEAFMGTKGIGFKTDVVGGGEPVEPKGKYKSSGYGDMPKTVKEGLHEAKKRPSVADEIKEIEKSNEALALEAKIAKIKEAIAKRESKLKIAESEDLKEMINPKIVKELQKEINELKKYQAKAEKMYEKLGGKKTVIDNEEITEDQDFDLSSVDNPNAYTDDIINHNAEREYNSSKNDFDFKKLAAHYGTAEYTNPESIKYDEDEDSWNLEFTMNIPKEDVMEMDNVAEADKYFNKEYNANSYQGPGSPFVKSYIDTTDGGNDWIVEVYINGGLDI